VSFKPYPKYKESGVEWLGKVPEHWEVRRLRQIGPLLKGSGGTKEDIVESGVPCVRYGDLYTTHSYFIRQARTFVTAERAADYFPIRRGDVLFAASGEDLAEIGRSAVNLIEAEAVCGGDTVVLRPNGRTVPAFLGYACDCWVAKAQKAAMGRGTTVKHIYPDELKRLVIFVPSLDEQAFVASFLDHETAKIDALIAEQQRLIELLQEKRQAVISHAVTKGLNPDAPMKDSRIEWLGQVPEHWEIVRLGHRGRLQNGLSIGGEAFGAGDPFVSYGDVYKNTVVPNTPSGLVQSTADDQDKYGLEVGDVLFTRTSESADDIGVAATCLRAIPRSTFAGFLIRFRPYPGTLDPGYSKYLFRNQGVQGHFAGTMNLVTRASLSQGELRSLPICVPPIPEQVLISAALDERVEQLRVLTADTESAISLLQERRSALISAAVTGQIDVRGFTAGGTEAA
jgi:type I restriction enzyme S subunit